ncbi:MAG: hypothetical protein KAR87_06715 [Candidatus Aenigmarchaeota archaeon]|nr:hypothetical protein [Candidatus Aenigmarchaeota archaeon]
MVFNFLKLIRTYIKKNMYVVKHGGENMVFEEKDNEEKDKEEENKKKKDENSCSSCCGCSSGCY